MSQRFVKGLTNNHLTWVMVDATDFATPESAVSAATTIKIYGKLRSGTGTNFVSSGTGSLTNDITHVGASALGIYTIALAKADLSDASAAWYDQYIVALSATGCARQVLVVDGGLIESYLSAALSDALSAAVALSDQVSNVQSYLVVMSGMLSDTHSAAILGASHASDAHSAALLAQSYASDAYSAAIIIQSRLSDFDSRTVSDISDIRSMLTALSDAISDAHSDLRSQIGGITATVSASDISDIASAVWAAKYTAHSAASSFGSLFSDVYSRVVLIQSAASDAASAAAQASSRILLVQSRLSDFNSAMISDISDIVSALTVIDSRMLLTQSHASNAHSAAVLAQSYASDAHSQALLLTTAHAEPTGVPAANATPLNKLGFVYAALRNKVTVTSTKMQFFDDADVALWEKDLTDDGTTYTETEGNAI